MTRKLALALTALATLAVGATAALAGTNRTGADPRVTSTSILLGATTPLSGPASAYASVTRGANAYFKYVNARGGVQRSQDHVQVPRRHVQPGADGAADAPARRAGQGLRDLQRDRHRAQPGRPRLPEREEGAAALRRLRRDDVGHATRPQYPYTIGFQPSYQAEGWVYGKYLARTRRGAKVAVLFQNDDYGKDLLNGLKKGIQRSKVKVVAAEPYEVTASDVQAQVAKLKASGANVFAIFATPKFAIQAYVYRQQARLEAEARRQQHRSRRPRTS